MKKQSIAEIKELLNEDNLTTENWEVLLQDERKGVQTLIQSYQRKKEREKLLINQFTAMQHYEKKAYTNGAEKIAGVDEVGRGPLAGPVVAAAVILPEDFRLIGLNDSKKLKEDVREAYSIYIKEHAVSYHISFIDNQTIDAINIYQATKKAMYEALEGLDPSPDHVLVDAVHLPGLHCSQEAIIKGDASSISIAAASVLAKVARDQFMKELNKEYPGYDFDKNMGYGTKAHLEGLNQFGVTPYHRTSFAPIKTLVK
ncbi:ribonuclease HII [Oceanobacillus jeddahense]|uniref:Ribonuclease HII n=1 Tax=Oceanobacillus jeddahense TaxID=1462527 RepID=A0ABY5JR73_9BACI|nr:ribonuclease HII [Oceanobacillus jeddahense]UUI01556.1 ribonuclease HII [Oceanobacillus jeddahense]